MIGWIKTKIILKILNVSDMITDNQEKTHGQAYRILKGESLLTKGQLISEQIYGVLNFPKMQRNITRISDIASKMGQSNKVKAHYHPI